MTRHDQKEIGVEEGVKNRELPQRLLRGDLQQMLQRPTELRVADDDVAGAGNIQDGQHELCPVDAVRSVAELQLREGAPRELVTGDLCVFLAGAVSVERLNRIEEEWKTRFAV